MIATTQIFSIQGIVCHLPLWFDRLFFNMCCPQSLTIYSQNIYCNIIISVASEATRQDCTRQDSTEQRTLSPDPCSRIPFTCHWGVTFYNISWLRACSQADCMATGEQSKRLTWWWFCCFFSTSAFASTFVYSFIWLLKLFENVRGCGPTL